MSDVQEPHHQPPPRSSRGGYDVLYVIRKRYRCAPLLRVALCKNLCNECDRSKIKLKRLSKRSKKAAMTVTTYKWTIERYHRAIEAGIFDDQPIELLRGHLIVMSPERELHAYY
ncbi:MAG: hypothetical protein ACYTXP_17450, partial [Nostoc sp.]